MKVRVVPRVEIYKADIQELFLLGSLASLAWATVTDVPSLNGKPTCAIQRSTKINGQQVQSQLCHSRRE